MPAAVVTDTVVRPDGTPAADVVVSVELAGEAGRRVQGYVGGVAIEGLHKPTVDEDGSYSVALEPNTLIEPAGTRWKFVKRLDGKPAVDYAVVPELLGGPFELATILDAAPGGLPTTALLAEIARATSAEAALLEQITDEVAARGAADVVETAARVAADALLIPLAQKAAPNGVATLDGDGFIPAEQIPAVALSEYLGAVASEAAMLALVGQKGDWAVRTDFVTDKVYLLQTDDPTLLANWTEITTPGAVLSVNGQIGAVIGLAEAADLVDEATLREAADDAEASARTAADALLLPLAGGELSGDLYVPRLVVRGLTGATLDTALVGGVAGGPPATGTFELNNIVADSTGCLWLCIVGGPTAPTNWARIGSANVETLSQEYSAADQTGISGTVDVTGLTGMQPVVGTRPQMLIVKVGKIRLTAGSVPSSVGLVLYEDAAIIDGVQSPSVPVAHATQTAASVTPPPFMVRRSAAQMAGKTYKVQIVAPSGTWSIQATNIPNRAQAFEV